MNLMKYTYLILNLFASIHLHSTTSITTPTPKPSQTKCITNNPISKNVIVIGAGAAGFAATSRLIENNITDVLMLEAEDRVGGRIHTINVTGTKNVVELGAQWIRGEKGNVVHELASGRRLLRMSVQMLDNNVFFQSNGQIFDQKLSDRLYEIYANIKIDDNVLDYKTPGNYYLEKINEALQSNNISINDDLKSQFLEYFHQCINSLDASDSWFHSSISNLIEYWECQGPHAIAWRKNGFRHLLSILSENADSKLKNSSKTIIYNYVKKQCEVIKIIPEDKRVRVKCDNGQEYIADHVIVTVSLGVLKASYEKLFPKNVLSDRTQNAIKYLSYGSVVKVYVRFPHRWWSWSTSIISLLWSQTDRLDYEKQGMKWLTDVFALDSVDNHESMLCAWVCGQSARDVEAMDQNIAKKQLMQMLRKFLGSKYNISEPDWFFRTTWKSNPHFYGAYSSRGISSQLMDVLADDLSIPVYNKKNIPVILFAGEATSPHHYSTVHGAIETGWREADRIIALKKSDQ